MGEIRQRGKVWWIRYYRNGRRYEESSHSSRKGDAVDLLRVREGDVARGVPVTPKIGRLLFEEAAADLMAEYSTNGRDSIDELERRLRLHLAPWFGGRRLASITTADVRNYIKKRQADTVVVRKAYDRTRKDGTVMHVPESRRTVARISNAEVNRELTTLKRLFNLARQNGKLLHVPYIPLLIEDNVRTGFFERDQFECVLAELPDALRPIAEFAYITGWRIDSEVLPLEWRQVDFVAGEVRLDPGSTKNRDGRVFPFTTDLRRLLEDCFAQHKRLRASGTIVPHVFVRMVANGRRGPKEPRPILSLRKAWDNACTAAGCPGQVPHDLRRTAVRNMVRAGVPERVAMKLTGHKTRSVFERYNIVSPGDLRSAARLLSEAAGDNSRPDPRVVTSNIS